MSPLSFISTLTLDRIFQCFILWNPMSDSIILVSSYSREINIGMFGLWSNTLLVPEWNYPLAIVGANDIWELCRMELGNRRDSTGMCHSNIVWMAMELSDDDANCDVYRFGDLLFGDRRGDDATRTSIIETLGFRSFSVSLWDYSSVTTT